MFHEKVDYGNRAGRGRGWTGHCQLFAISNSGRHNDSCPASKCKVTKPPILPKPGSNPQTSEAVVIGDGGAKAVIEFPDNVWLDTDRDGPEKHAIGQ